MEYNSVVMKMEKAGVTMYTLQESDLGKPMLYGLGRVQPTDIGSIVVIKGGQLIIENQDQKAKRLAGRQVKYAHD